jgi:hypothetical protein
MIALVNLLLAAPAALAQDSASAGASASTSGAPAPAASNTPPFNSSAPDPWWPQYPENRSVSEFMMNSSASDADLRGETDIAQWIVAASNLWRNQFG